MTPSQMALSIAIMALITFLTRALPFLLFGRMNTVPRVVLYLGKYLPPAVIAMLIVYCFRTISFHAFSDWLPSLLAGGAVVALHLWKRRNMLSIAGGTILYMILVQVIF